MRLYIYILNYDFIIILLAFTIRLVLLKFITRNVQM